MKTQQKLAVLSTALVMAMTATAFAAEEEDSDPWRFGVTVPLWAPAIDGDVTLRGQTKHVSISFQDLKDHLDASFAMGAQVRKEQFGFFGNVGYLKFDSEGGVNWTLKILIAEAGALVRVMKVGETRPFTLDATAGLRYWWVDNNLTLQTPIGTLKNNPTYELYDPVLGLRASQYLLPKFHIDVGADVGGFGISANQAKVDWSATGVGTYDFFKWLSVSAGYKALGLDIHNGFGDQKKGLNITMHGLLVAATVKF